MTDDLERKLMRREKKLETEKARAAGKEKPKGKFNFDVNEPSWTLDDERTLKSLKKTLENQNEAIQKPGGSMEETMKINEAFLENADKIAKLQEKRRIYMGGEGKSWGAEGVPSEAILPKTKKEKPIKDAPVEAGSMLGLRPEGATADSRDIVGKEKIRKGDFAEKLKDAVKDLEKNRGPEVSSAPLTGPEQAPVKKGWKSILEIFKRKKKDVDAVTPTAAEEAEINKEVTDLPKSEREKLGWGIKTLGLKLRQSKSNFFASTFGAIGKHFDKKGTMGRFTSSLKEGFQEDADRDNALVKKRSGIKGQVVDKLTLIGNIAKYGRLITDFTSHSMASPFRYYIAAAMATSRLSEAAKGARLKNEEVMEKTRIQDVDKAYEEAWAIHEKALGKAGDEAVSKEALENAYLAEMPKNIVERLKNTSVANGMVQKMVGKQMTMNLGRLEKAIDKIDKNDKLTKEQKEEKKLTVLKSWQKVINDYDRIVSQVGAVDGMATAALYAQKGARGVVYALTAETLYMSAEKLFHHMAEAFSSAEADHAAALSNAPTNPELKVPVSREFPPDYLKAHGVGLGQPPAGPVDPSGLPVSHEFPADYLKEHGASLGNPPQAPSGPGGLPVSHEFPPEYLKAHGVSLGNPPGAPGVLTPSHEFPPDYLKAHGISLQEPLNTDAVVGKGQGIEHAFIRQIEKPELAKQFGWDGKENLHAFAQKQAHLLAMKEGYVSADGHEIRVAVADKVAYQIHMSSDGKPEILERTLADGKVIETHHAGEAFETNKENYEYEHGSRPQTTLGNGIADNVSKAPENLPRMSAGTSLDQATIDQYQADLGNPPAGSTAEEIKAKLEDHIDKHSGPKAEEPGTYKGYQKPSKTQLDWAEEQRANATYKPYNSPGQTQYGQGGHLGGERLKYYDLSPAENHILKNHSDFDHKFYDLTPKERIGVFRANERIADHVFGSHEGPVWRNLGNLRADKVMEIASEDPLKQNLAGYLTLIKNFAEQDGAQLKPKGGGLFRGPETVERYIARGLQKLASVGKLDDLEEAVKKSNVK